MMYLLALAFFGVTQNNSVIFNFNKQANIGGWQIVDDVVMGGKSSGSFALNAEGNGQFKGEISLDNNGGFSSVQYKFKKIKVNKDNKIVMKIKGEGKTYQLRVKSNTQQFYSYIASFKTSGTWQQIEIPLKDMYPSFRGQKLTLPNFSHDSLEEIVFLIGNKTPEKFELQISNIALN